MNSLVSIIIPSYNAVSTLDETLDCVCQQSWPDLEVIVVDDGSTDGTADLAERYEDERVRVIRNQNAGACHARNVGIEAANGDYIQFLDADDLFVADKIELQLQALTLKDDPRAITYGPWWEFIDVPGRSSQVCFCNGRSFSEPMEWLFASMAEGFYLPPHCWLIPHAVVLQAGAWDERLLQNQDGDFFSRVLQRATQVVWVADAISYYRGGNAGSVSSKKGRDYTESLLLASDMIRDRMLCYLEGDLLRQSCVSALYLRMLYRMDHSNQEMIDTIWTRIESLGLPPREVLIGGEKFNALKKVLGWRLSFQVKNLLNR